MVKFTAQKLRKLMDGKDNIRNISLIGDCKHGKSTLRDRLVEAAGVTAHEVGEMTDTQADEYAIPVQSSAISLYYEMTDDYLKNNKGVPRGNEYLVNLIDEAESASLCISDGALLVVGCGEGVCDQTKTVLRQALREGIQPVLTMSKIDQVFFLPKMDEEAVYQRCKSIVDDANAVVAACEDTLASDFRVCPKKGNVVFASGLHGWAFTLRGIAKMFCNNFNCEESDFVEKLWGETFYDKATKQWTSWNTGSATCKRGFIFLIYEPIREVIGYCMYNEKEILWQVLEMFGVTMEDEDKELKGVALMMRVMQTWFPASNALLESTICHVPSPATAQKYRSNKLCKGGSLGDAYDAAIRNCNPEGPPLLYVPEMVGALHEGGFFASGRVFSGKVSTGLNVRIMSPDMLGEEEEDLYVERSFVWMGSKWETVQDVPCGNIVTCEISAPSPKRIKLDPTLKNEEVGAHPIRAM